MENFYTDNKDLSFHLNHPMMSEIVGLKERNYSDRCSFDYAPSDYEDAMDSYEKTLEIVGDISGNLIAPNAGAVDTEGPKIVDNRVVYAEGTRRNYDALRDAGLIGMSLPRKHGGLNFPIVPYVMAAELVSRADAGFSTIWGLQDCAETIHEFASDELQDLYLPLFNKGATAAMTLTEPDAGSDLQAVRLKAAWDGQRGSWVLNGVKRFITNGDADISLVLARTEDGSNDGRGLSLFLYDRTSNAVIVRRIENKLGIKGSPTCELVFKDAPARLLGERKLGLIKYVMSLMNAARIGIGAQSVGISEAAYREALKYARERSQFGKLIIEFPAVYELLAGMKVKLQASRSLLYETARFVDVYKNLYFISRERKLDAGEKEKQKKYQKLADVFTPLLKLIASEYCNQLAYDAIQVHGGAGYMKDFPVERIYRDARITSIYEGTSQLQVIAAIRGVTTGIYLNRINEYVARDVSPDMEYLKQVLIGMTGEYESIVFEIVSQNNDELLDFHARRLVEMAGNIIMGFLLMEDATRDESYKKSVKIFTGKVQAENRQMATYIKNFDPKETGLFRSLPVD